MRTVHGKWMMAQVLDNGDIVAWFTGGGIARARYNDEPMDATEDMLYDRPVWEALAPLRTADPTWLKSVDYNTRFVVSGS